MRESVTFSSQPVQEDEISLLDFWMVIRKRSYVIGGFCGLAVLVALFISLLQPKFFESTTTILPDSQNNSVLVTLLRSQTIGERIVSDQNLVEHYQAASVDDAIKTLLSRTNIKNISGKIISITVADQESHLAASIANNYVVNLVRLNHTLSAAKFTQNRLFLEKQLQENNLQLAKAEEAIKEFQRENKVVVYAQSPGMMVTEAGIQGQIIAQEVHIKMLNNYLKPDDATLVRAKSVLEGLRSQLSLMKMRENYQLVIPNEQLHPITMTEPYHALQYGRLMRELMVQETQHILLTSQNEQAKLEEAKAKSMLTLQVLDPAVPRNFTKEISVRSNIIIAGGVALIIGIIIAFFLEYLERLRTTDKPISPSHAVG